MVSVERCIEPEGKELPQRRGGGEGGKVERSQELT